jgi:putative membrane-bound dehydrogenase-like protein
MMGTIDDQGRLFIAESSGNTLNNQQMAANPDYKIRLLEDRNHDGVYDHSTIFADHLTLPAGAVWLNGSLYVASPPDLLKFTDTDNDGISDKKEVIVTGWNMSANAASLHGPFLGPDGYLYLTDGRHGFDITTKDAHYKGDASRIWRVRPDGTGLEWFAGGGFDNPVEVVFTPAGEMIGTMTYFKDPANGERDALLNFVEGGVYPKPHPTTREFKRTGELMPVMTKFARIAPAGLLRYNGGALGPQYQGNLFSAQFNPHRVQRHIVHRIGATFRTEDQDFMTSTDPDFHPTDVIQDKDGSLLVLDTGAWFIHGCPISRVAKPEIKGAVYRIKRKTRPPAATDRAHEAAVAAVFHQSPEAVRKSLSSPSFEIRTAAARCAGMSKDKEALDRLIAMVKKDHPVPRRQAAAALGQIGDPKAVSALLIAAANPEDRFVEHSIIYSLILLNQPAALQAALSSPSLKVRKAALIALDQLDNSPLKQQEALPLLSTRDRDLRNAALFVISHHPDWAPAVLDFLNTRLHDPTFAGHETDLVRDALTAFADNPATEKLVAELLQDRTLPPKQQQFLLETIDGFRQFPKSWEQALGPLLEARNAKALDIVKSRGLTGLDPQLTKIADDPAAPATLRVSALNALVTRHPQLTDSQYDLLIAKLDPRTDAILRQSAAQVIARSNPDKPRLLQLGRNVLPKADPLTLTTLLDCFRNSQDAEVGATLLAILKRSPAVLGTLGEQRLKALIQPFPEITKKNAEPLFQALREAEKARINRLRKLEPLLTAGGDVGRGRRIFFGEKVACYSCHTIGQEGGHVGPDLTGVGAIRSGHDLLEAIVFPSASFVPGFEIYTATTANDRVSGVLKSQGREAVVLVTGPNEVIRIPRTQIKNLARSNVSLMPEGFDENLTSTELTDLLAFLQAEKASPPTLEAGRPR